jgi:hypothetical protein
MTLIPSVPTRYRFVQLATLPEATGDYDIGFMETPKIIKTIKQSLDSE